MSGEPIVSVYMPCRNYGHFIEEAIESVLNQSFDQWELFLIDNGSTDNTWQVMQLYQHDPRINLLQNEDTTIASAANLCLQRARGEYIVRLDADDVFDENALLVLSHYLHRHPKDALVFPDYYLMDPFGSVFAHERKRSVKESEHTQDMPPNGACTMIRKSAMAEVGGYRSDLNAQDGWDIWTRLREKYRCGHVSVPLFYYRRHGDNMTCDAGRMFAARRRVKWDEVKEKMADIAPVVAVIPCRMNYDFVKDLWSVPVLYNKTLLDLAVERALASSLFDYVVVTSDNPDTQDALVSYKDPRLLFMERSTESTFRSRSLAHTLREISEGMSLFAHGMTVLNYVQSPFVTTESLEEAATTLVFNDGDSSVAMEEVTSALYKRTSHGMMPLSNSSALVSEFDKVYREMRITQALKNENFIRGNLLGRRTVHFELPSRESFFIANQRDLSMAKILLQQESSDAVAAQLLPS